MFASLPSPPSEPCHADVMMRRPLRAVLRSLRVERKAPLRLCFGAACAAMALPWGRHQQRSLARCQQSQGPEGSELRSLFPEVEARKTGMLETADGCSKIYYEASFVQELCCTCHNVSTVLWYTWSTWPLSLWTWFFETFPLEWDTASWVYQGYANIRTEAAAGFGESQRQSGFVSTWRSWWWLQPQTSATFWSGGGREFLARFVSLLVGLMDVTRDCNKTNK